MADNRQMWIKCRSVGSESANFAGQWLIIDIAMNADMWVQRVLTLLENGWQQADDNECRRLGSEGVNFAGQWPRTGRCRWNVEVWVQRVLTLTLMAMNVEEWGLERSTYWTWKHWNMLSGNSAWNGSWVMIFPIHHASSIIDRKWSFADQFRAIACGKERVMLYDTQQSGIYEYLRSKVEVA